MKTRNASLSLWMGLLLVTVIGVCPLPAQGGLVANYDFAGTTGGNVTDTVGGRNLTAGVWSSTNPADFFQLWSGTVVAEISLSENNAWPGIFDITGNTTGDWDRVWYGLTTAPGNIAAPTLPYTPNAYLGVQGNGEWKYLNFDPSPVTVPTGQLVTITTAWDFDDVANTITMSMWVGSTLRGTADVTPGYYPGIGGANNYRLNSISLSDARVAYSEVLIYDEFIPVPEPATIILLSIGGVVLSQKRKRV